MSGPNGRRERHDVPFGEAEGEDGDDRDGRVPLSPVGLNATTEQTTPLRSSGWGPLAAPQRSEPDGRHAVEHTYGDANLSVQ